MHVAKRNHSNGRQRFWQIVLVFLAVVAMVGGAYLFFLTRAPALIVAQPEDMQAAEHTYQQDKTDYIKIEKLNLLVPVYAGTDASILEKGAWHRFPERGDPIKGGNFIVSAHRFQLGATPQGTKAKSPFYHLDKIQAGDEIKVYYQGAWYDYTVSHTYSVKPDEVSIEAPSDMAKLTLYSCTLGGSADGRIVVEAAPRTLPSQ